MFSSLKVREFRIYWFGMLLSLIGSWIQITAQSWLVFQLTDSAFLLGVVGFLSSIPVFFLSLFGGVLADRRDKRIILIFTQSAFMLLAFLLAVLTQFNLVTPAQIMLIALLNGIVMAFDAPSRQSVVVELVGKVHLANAIALNSVAFNSSRIVGPALAGVLIAAIGMAGCFYINGISFLAVIIALFLIKANSSPQVSNKAGAALKDLREGLSFIWKERTILGLLAIVGIVSLFGISYVILMPVFAQDILHSGVRGLSLLISSAGCGALVGALILARLGDFKHKGRFLIYSSFLFAAALVLFSLSKIFIFSQLVLFFLGLASITSVATINILLQHMIPDSFRGRVMSLFMFTFAGIMPFGNLIAGALAQAIGVSAAVLINGIICGFFFIAVNTAFPKIRQL